jgi:DNA invertase Pin-like site-specific DNA recombinase
VLAGTEYTRRHGTKGGNAIGRPRRVFDRAEVLRLRASGLSIEEIACQMRLGVGTVVRVLQVSSLNRIMRSDMLDPIQI